MPFVSLVTEEQAKPDLKKRYEEIRQSMGFVPNFFTAQGSKPALIAAQMALVDSTMDNRAVPRILKKQIGMVVSGLNTSSYCVALHMEFLRQFGVAKELSRKLAVDYPNAPFGEKEQALFRFADKLTRHPDELEPADAEELKKHGWDEAALLEAVTVVAFFNYVNRVSIGLGLVADF